MLRQVCIVAFVVGTVAAAAAQPQAPPQRVAPPQGGAPSAPAGDAAADALPEAQLMVMLDSYAMFQAQQQLSISDDKFGVFAGRLKKLQDVRRRNQRMRHRIVLQLRGLVNPRSPTAGDDNAIRAQLTLLKEHDQRAAAELQQAYDALDEVLDARQQARYRIFEEQIEQRKLDLLMRAREKARQNRQR
jgi:hypothetical protein